jgi:hypothetical protein
MNPAPTLVRPLHALWQGAARVLGLTRRAEKTAMSCKQSFAKAAGVDAEKFMNLLTSGMDVTHTKMRQLANGAFQISYKSKVFSEKFSIDFAQGHILEGMLTSHESGQGIGRHIFARRLAAGIYLGLEQLDLNAGMMMGGFVWARAGVKMHEGDRYDVSVMLRERLDLIRDRLDDQTYERVADLIQLQRDGDLNALTRLDTKLGGIAAIWNTARHREEQYPIEFKSYRRRGHVKDNSMTLGQYLMFGMYYRAHVDLNDAAQMRLVEQYTNTPIRTMAAGWGGRPQQTATPALQLRPVMV